jgi:2-methylfumaryl-CoA isomerase
VSVPTAVDGILAGLRIVEVTAFIAAPLCGLTLAQLGADVVRVDPPGGNLDIGRLPLAPSGQSLYWASLNRGKRSVEIDLRKSAGKQLLRRMLAGSGKNGGILVTNLPLDGELAYESLREARRDLIMVQLSGSPDGRSELDYTVNCAVGFPSITGTPATAPVNHVLPAWDAIAGLTLANGVLAAERRRRESGEGQLVTVSLSDVAMSMVSNLGYIADVEVNGAERKADGNYLYGAYGDTFRTLDGRHVMVVAISDRQWQALVKVLGVESALVPAADALQFNLADEGGRYAARELISAFFRPWFSRRTLAAIEAELSKHRVLWGAYRTFSQMLDEDPRCSDRNPMFGRVDHPGIGNVLTSATPLAFSDASRVSPGVAPRLGEHTGMVLREWGGLEQDEITRLAAARVIGAEPSSEAKA